MSFLKNLFGGGGTPQAQFTPPGFNAGGLNATFGGGQYTVTPSADRTAAVSGIASTFGQEASALGKLAPQFAPGFSALRTAQLNNISANRTSAIGDLRQNLQSRRVLGSSFAQDAINRTAAEYDKQQSDTIAQTYLQELQATQQITQQEFEAARGQYQTGLNELNLEAGLASDLTSRASSSLASIAQSNADLQAKAQAGAGSFLGNLIGTGANLAGRLFAGSGTLGLFGGSRTNLADLGIGNGVGSGGYNFLDAQA